ncbi:MAG: hypothetical protein WCF57_17490 [Pyrinomonadaceae bacterium]
MSIRPAIAFLLVISMTLAATGRAHANNSPRQTQEDTRLTFDEELEARSVAEQFVKRFEESDDLLSIVADLYVSDFNDRLRRDPIERFAVPVDPELAAQVDGDELSRYHITWLKFTYLYMLLLSAAWHQSASHLNGNAKPDDDDEQVPRLDEVLSPRLIALFRDDPALAELLIEESNKDDKKSLETNVGNDPTKPAEERDQTIRTRERLRAYVSTLEKGVALMREHLRTQPAPQTWQTMMDSMREPGQEADNDSMDLHATILTRDDFGEPKGSRLICLKAMLFHMDLIRVDGQLKILNVYVADD